MMWEDITREIEQTKLQMRDKVRYEGQLEKCENDLEAEKVSQRAYREELEKNQDHVQKLEGMSITHLFHFFLGNLEEQEAQAAQKILQLKMKLDMSNSSVLHLETERENLNEKIRQLAGVEEKYARLMDEKSKMMTENPGVWANHLSKLIDARVDVLGLQKEVKEAYQAAGLAYEALNECDNSLGKAEGWGTFDMLGGGLISTAIKRGHMDDANQAALSAENALRTLARELKDVKMSLDTPLTSGGLLSFSDYFFDGLIVDWMVQREIHNAQGAVSDQISEVEDVMQQLEQADVELKNRLQRLEEDYAKIIEQAN